MEVKIRTNYFLENRLNYIWQKYFADVKKSNEVSIVFGRGAKKRLGSIKATIKEPIRTQITINKHFQDKNIPSYIIDAIIAHELCHYAHGFASPLPKTCRFPHRGGIIDREMERRGLGDLLEKENVWLHHNWARVVN